MTNGRKLLLILLDGVPYRNWRRLFGNLEGWVASGEARVWKMRSVLPSTSATCYASIHTGVPPQVHQIWGNSRRRRLEFPDVFSEVTKAGGKTGAVTHSFWSEFFNRYPFDPVTDLDYDDPQGPITHGRFHTMTGDSRYNQATPSDPDLFATLTMLAERRGIDYGILHTCTLDSMGHRFFHDCEEMDDACFRMDEALAHFLSLRREGKSAFLGRISRIFIERRPHQAGRGKGASGQRHRPKPATEGGQARQGRFKRHHFPEHWQRVFGKVEARRARVRNVEQDRMALVSG